MLEKNRRIQAHFKIIERFLDVSKVILNRFQELLALIKNDYVASIGKNESKLKELINDASAFSTET
jgi:plasmid maintenance system antidote protein VapI